MSPELQQKLFDAFPLLYADVGKPASETPMHWGITCDDGWYQIIWNLSFQLENMIRIWVFKNLEHEADHPRAVQVKEKMGILRVYLSSNCTHEMKPLATEASFHSKTTCELCGAKTASICKATFLLKTLCNKCAIENGFVQCS